MIYLQCKQGNCYAVKSDLENAKNMYIEAIRGESDCVEAIFNLGIYHLSFSFSLYIYLSSSFLFFSQ